MNLTLTRAHKKPDVTMGMLSVENASHLPICTLELPWNDNKREISCIPVGTYQVWPHVSPKDGKCWMVADVPNRENILIHSANEASKLLGCIAIGLSAGQMNGIPAVLQSRDAIAYLRTLVGEHQFTLTIV